MIQIIALSTELLVVAALLALPRITRRDLLFGVPIPDGFRSTDAARAVLRNYTIAVCLAGVAAVSTIVMTEYPGARVAALLLISIVGVASYWAQNARLKPHAIQPSSLRTVDFTRVDEPLPWFVWLGVLPLLLIAAAALYLHFHWDQIPVRYPVHFTLDGTPNRWVDRSVRGVYGFLVFGAEMTMVLFALGLAGWFGSRRSDSMRRPVLALMIAVEWTIAPTFAIVPLRLATGLPISLPLIVLLPLIMLVPALIYFIRASNQPRDPLDPTPNECWKGGMFYYNPNDAVLFVQRRDGFGYTVNFANRLSWALLGSLVVVFGSAPLILS